MQASSCVIPTKEGIILAMHRDMLAKMVQMLHVAPNAIVLLSSYSLSHLSMHKTQQAIICHTCSNMAFIPRSKAGTMACENAAWKEDSTAAATCGPTARARVDSKSLMIDPWMSLPIADILPGIWPTCAATFSWFFSTFFRMLAT
jgi:hypothetical protein